MTYNVQRARELMDRSRAEHFAVGAFNVDNHETLLAIVRAAKVKHASVLAELSHAEAEVIGLANMRSLVDNYRAEHEVEVYTQPWWRATRTTSAAARTCTTRRSTTRRSRKNVLHPRGCARVRRQDGHRHVRGRRRQPTRPLPRP